MFALTLQITLVAVLLFGCNYRENKLSTTSPEVGGDPNPSSTPTPSSSPTPPKEWFTALQREVFNPKCVECHRPGNAKGDVILTTYRDVMDADPPIIKPGKPMSSVLYQCIVHTDPEKRMPKGGAALSELETKAIYNWIIKGAPETNPDAPSQDLSEDF